MFPTFKRMLANLPAQTERVIIAALAVLGLIGILIDETVRSLVPTVAAVAVVCAAGGGVRLLLAARRARRATVQARPVEPGNREG